MSSKKAINNFRKLIKETKQLQKEKQQRILKENYKDMPGPGDWLPRDPPPEEPISGHDIEGELIGVPSSETVGGKEDIPVLVDFTGEITGPTVGKDNILKFKVWEISGYDENSRPIKGKEIDSKIVDKYLDWETVINNSRQEIDERLGSTASKAWDVFKKNLFSKEKTQQNQPVKQEPIIPSTKEKKPEETSLTKEPEELMSKSIDNMKINIEHLINNIKQFIEAEKQKKYTDTNKEIGKYTKIEEIKGEKVQPRDWLSGETKPVAVNSPESSKIEQLLSKTKELLNLYKQFRKEYYSFNDKNI